MEALTHPRASILLLSICLLLTGCFDRGEPVNSSSAVVRTSVLPASVPYYVDPCGQNGDIAEYRLYAPAQLRLWREGKIKASSELRASDQAVLAKRHQRCVSDLKIENGDAITVRLHRVGLGGLARFADFGAGNCLQGCRRDIAVVIDFNGSANLQKPIVAFYQTDVPPDGLLQFFNQTIFTQDEWFYRFPPNVRVRVYDVRDDKDKALRANLDTVRRGINLVKSYISGAAIAGPIVDTAFKAADQLLSQPRNRAIIDMSFQLFPEIEGAKLKRADYVGDPCAADVKTPDTDGKPLTAETLAQLHEVCLSRKALLTKISTGSKALKQFQRDHGLTADGVIGARTRAALVNAGLPETADGDAIRKFYEDQSKRDATQTVAAEDATFGAPIYAANYIVFNENAYGLKRPPGMTANPPAPLRAQNCQFDGTTDRGHDNRRRLTGETLPDFYFVPDGVEYFGARIHARYAGTKDCVLESPFVVFSITRESSAVSVDVAQRISDLGNKFTVAPAVTEEILTTLSSTVVDGQLALAIDRLENRRRPVDLFSMVSTLFAQLERANNTTGVGTDDDSSQHPKPSANYRSRVYRLITDYTGCVVTDDNWKAELQSIQNLKGDDDVKNWKRIDGGDKPYFGKPARGCDATEAKVASTDQMVNSTATPAAETSQKTP